MKETALIERIPPNGVLSVIQKDIDSGGEYFALTLLRELLKRGETVFVFLYEPFTVFKRNCEHVGLDVSEYLGDKLIVFDVFGSIYHIPLPEEGIHQLAGYLDDSVFIIKLREWANATILSKDWGRLWVFTYTSTGVCKLFSRPSLVYKLIWGLRRTISHKVRELNTVLTLSTPECPEIEDLAYFASDIVVETFTDFNGRRVGIVTKGSNEGMIFDLFGGGK